jgi:hypothetical protein
VSSDIREGVWCGVVTYGFISFRHSYHPYYHDPVACYLFLLDVTHVDTIRQRVWPKLVGLDHNYEPILPPFSQPQSQFVVPTTTTSTVCEESKTDDQPSPPTQQEAQQQHSTSAIGTPSRPRRRFEIDASELNVQDGYVLL